MQSCFYISKNQFLKNLCTGTHRGWFQFLLILDLWGITFNAVVVFGLGKDLLFKSVLGHCVPCPPYFRRPCMYFELLNEPDSDNYYKYLEVCCYQKVNTIKRMRFNIKISVLFTNHLKKCYYSAIFAFLLLK